jgi:uncharacterized protein (TIGR02246 family)
MPATVSPANSPARTVLALTKLVAELQRTQQSEDVKGFVALFDEDAVWVTGGGSRLIGRDAISEFTQTVLPGAFADNNSVTYHVDHILFISDDIALTSVSQEYFDAQGVSTGRGLPSYIWRRNGDTWRIVMGQNTAVPSPEN